MERWEESGEAYREALALVSNEAERKFLQRRLAHVQGKI
jgi:predicted RNA polymerase sigma factor